MSLSQAIPAKAEKVEEIKKLLTKFETIAVASLEKVRAPQLQLLRRKLQKDAYLQVTKNTLVKRAIVTCQDKPGLEKLDDHLKGANIFMFTNLNPFKLALLLTKSRVKTSAKAGDTAAFDVTIPAGNTGLPPGPIISQFTAVGVPTRIEAGSVWVSRNTMVVKRGEFIEARLASLLSKLDIKPVEIGLTVKAVYDEGMVLVEEDLQVDLDHVRKEVQEAYTLAFNLSIKTAIPLPANIRFLLYTAHNEAYRLAFNASVPNLEIIGELIRKAYTESLIIKNILNAQSEKAPSDNSIQKG